MSNFSLTFYDEESSTDDPYGRKLDRFGRPITLRAAEDKAKERAKIEKAARYRGPWCSNCGKRGKNCRDHYKCSIRVIERHKVPAIDARTQGERYAEVMAAKS